MPYTMTYTGYEYDEPETIKREEEEMTDPTEGIRRALVSEINSRKSDRQILEEKYGQVWDTDEVTQDFIVEGFFAPYVVVIRRSDRKRGSLTFQHSPRYYFDFKPDPLR